MNLIVIGSHSEAKNEVAKAIELFNGNCDFMAIGVDAVLIYEDELKYMATFHPDDILEAKKRRRNKGLNDNFQVISHREKDKYLDGTQKMFEVDIIEPYDTKVGDVSGSSALLGVKNALKQGYTKIILCGCPMTGKNDKNHPYETFRKGWEKEKELVKENVRSLSGWTREFLNEPTKEWLNGTKGEV